MNTAPVSECSTATTEASDTPRRSPSVLPRKFDRYLIDIDSQSGFSLFILVNAALFLRPMDMLPRLAGWPIYEVLIGASLLISFRRVLEQLTPVAVLERPITACVLGVWVTVVLSHLSHFHRAAAAVSSGVEFSKLVVFYLLLVGIVNTPNRLLWFLRWLAVFACMHIGLAVIQHYGLIDLPAMRPVEEMALARATGDTITAYRICGAGIFHDTNDLAVLVSITLLLCMYHMTNQSERRGTGRWLLPLLWLCGIVLCLHAMMLTQSRGGLIAMLAGLGVFFFIRFGWKSTLLLALAPLIPILFSGRQSDHRMLSRTTAQMRLRFWEEGLSLFGQSPVFGIGHGNFVKSIGNVAHNSFVHCYTELGFFGGTFFLGAFFLAFWPIYRLRLARDCGTVERGELQRLRPFFLAIVAAWVMGMFSLSRSYVAPTYIIAGLGTVYLGLLTQGTSLPRPKLDGRLAMGLAGLSAACLAVVYSCIVVLRKG